jgi:uncharacterized protein (DUF58 family)
MLCSPFSAIRNNDKVGLLLFTDKVELYIPAKKGRSHTLRLIREVLFFEPQARGTDPALALALPEPGGEPPRRRILRFRFPTGDFSRELAVSGRRHDFIAIHVQDEREQVLPNVGIITLEDAETASRSRSTPAIAPPNPFCPELAASAAAELEAHACHRSNIDTIPR